MSILQPEGFGYSRPDEVDSTINETLTAFVFMLYVFLRFISYTS